MSKRDGRTLSHKKLAELRQEAVRRRECGESVIEIAKSMKLHRGSIARWIIRHEREGEEIFRSHQPTGCPLKLDFRANWEKIIKALQESSVIWTRSQLQEHLNQKLKLSMSVLTVWRQLKEIGVIWNGLPDMGCRKQWLQIQWTRIRRFARKEKALIFFVKDFEIKDKEDRQTLGFVLSAHGGRKRVFYAFSEKISVEFFLNFIKALLKKHNGEKIFLIAKRKGPYSAGSEKIQRLLFFQRNNLKIFYIIHSI